MGKIGTEKRPAIVRVHTEDQASEVMAMAEIAKIKVIVGVEPNKVVDIFDMKKALKERKIKFKFTF